MPFSKQLKAYLDEYRTVKKAGEKIGVSVLLGAEVGIATPKCDYTEFVLFGVMEKFLLSSPALHLLSQPALYNLCHDNGILMYQAHPFRIGHIPADPGFMDGVEINLHRNFLSNTEEVYEFADKYSLGVSLGSDVHYHNQPGAGAILAPDDIKTSGDLAKFLKTTPRPQLYRR